MKKSRTPEGLLTRAEFGKAVRKSKTTVRRWEDAGKVKPTIGEGGARFYTVEDAQRMNGGEPIETLPRARPYVPTAAAADGELGAKIFERLERGMHPVEVVVDLESHPDVVEGFVGKWTRMRKSVFFSTEQVRKIMETVGIRRFDGAAELVEKIQRAVGKLLTCRNCGENATEFCSPCTQNAIAYQVQAQVQARQAVEGVSSDWDPGAGAPAAYDGALPQRSRRTSAPARSEHRPREPRRAIDRGDAPAGPTSATTEPTLAPQPPTGDPPEATRAQDSGSGEPPHAPSERWNSWSGDPGGGA